MRSPLVERLTSTPVCFGDEIYFGWQGRKTFTQSTPPARWTGNSQRTDLSSLLHPALGANLNLVFGSEDGNVYSVTINGRTGMDVFDGRDRSTCSPAVRCRWQPCISALGDGNIYSLFTGFPAQGKKWAYKTKQPHPVRQALEQMEGCTYSQGHRSLGLKVFMSQNSKCLPPRFLPGRSVTGSIVTNLPAPVEGAYFDFSADNPAINLPVTDHPLARSTAHAIHRNHEWL